MRTIAAILFGLALSSTTDALTLKNRLQTDDGSLVAGSGFESQGSGLDFAPLDYGDDEYAPEYDLELETGDDGLLHIVEHEHVDADDALARGQTGRRRINPRTAKKALKLIVDYGEPVVSAVSEYIGSWGWW